MRYSVAASLILVFLLAASVVPYVLVDAQLLDTFVINFSPTTLSVMEGDSGSVFITVTSVNNFSAPVSLAFSDAPIGVSISFDNNPVYPPPGGSDSSTAYFSVDSTVPVGTYSMTLTGTSGSTVNSYPFTLQVTPQPMPGDFAISVSPQTVTAPAGETASSIATIASINSFSSPVTLTASGQPPGVSVNFSPTTVTPSAGGTANSGITISVDSAVQAGSYPITITGSGSTGTAAVITEHSTELDLQVSSAQDFALTIDPSSVSIRQGEATTATVTVTSIGGFSSPVGLSTSNGLPSGVQVSFSPNPITPGSSTMSVNVASSAGTGTYSFQVLGTSGTLSHTTTFTMTISSASQPSFSLSSSLGSVSTSQGGSASVKITVSSINHFSAPVSTSLAWVGAIPTGVTVAGPGTLTPPKDGTTSGMLTVSATSNAPVGSFLLTVVGTSGSLTASATIGVQILTGVGDFSISLSPSSLTVIQGSTATSTLTIQSSGAFSSPVTLSASPANGLGVSFATNPLLPSAGGRVTTQVTVTVTGEMSTGTYVVPITGTSGLRSHSSTITITVNQAVARDFTVVAGPSSITITQGSSGSSVIAVLSQAGFNSPVSLTAAWQDTVPNGVSLNLPSPITPQPNTIATSTLTVSASLGSATGTYVVTVTGSSGGLVHTTQVTVQIFSSTVTTTMSTSSSLSSSSTTTTPPGPKCFIATATYGSPLAPQVQLLRNLRDNRIMKTYVGWNFMVAFNAWYYSFSPTVAQTITQHQVLQSAMKIVLYPLIAILQFGTTPYTLLSEHQDLAAVVSGLLITSLIGAVYLALPIAALSACSSKLRRMTKRISRLAAVTLALSLAGITAAELTTLSPLMIISTATTALTTLFISALLAARVILQVVDRVKHRA